MKITVGTLLTLVLLSSINQVKVASDRRSETKNIGYDDYSPIEPPEIHLEVLTEPEPIYEEMMNKVRIAEKNLDYVKSHTSIKPDRIDMGNIEKIAPKSRLTSPNTDQIEINYEIVQR